MSDAATFSLAGTVPNPTLNGALLGGCVVPLLAFWCAFAYVYRQLLADPVVDFQMINRDPLLGVPRITVEAHSAPSPPLVRPSESSRSPMLVTPNANNAVPLVIPDNATIGSPLRLAHLSPSRRWDSHPESMFGAANSALQPSSLSPIALSTTVSDLGESWLQPIRLNPVQAAFTGRNQVMNRTTNPAAFAPHLAMVD